VITVLEDCNCNIFSVTIETLGLSRGSKFTTLNKRLKFCLWQTIGPISHEVYVLLYGHFDPVFCWSFSSCVWQPTCVFYYLHVLKPYVGVQMAMYFVSQVSWFLYLPYNFFASNNFLFHFVSSGSGSGSSSSSSCASLWVRNFNFGPDVCFWQNAD
jgi:hypothetical protein